MNIFAEGLLMPVVEKCTGNTAVAVLIAGILVSAVIGYFLGSLNFALILSGKMYKDDIRKHGSKNAGMTNMMRTYGSKAAGLTILGDMLKAIVAVLIGFVVIGHNFGGYAAAFGCVIGHVFPAYYGFKGGKGVATAAASILMLDWRAFLVVVAIFVLCVVFTRFISLGSVLSAAVFPLLTFYLNHDITGGRYYSGGWFAFFMAFLIALLVILKHHENLSRLAHGTENKFSFKKSKKSENDKK
jgi:glycerol-3-phosphate acyltransferase PlsY